MQNFNYDRIVARTTYGIDNKFEHISNVDQDLQLRKAAEAIAEDIHMKAMNCKHESTSKEILWSFK